MTRSRLTRVALSLALIGILALIPKSGMASHVRTGTIGGGIGFMAPMDCAEAPDCAAWLASDCNAALAPPSPLGIAASAESSIVDVGALANGSTTRWFEIEPLFLAGHVAGGVVVQLWRSNCTEVTAARRSVTSDATFAIPTDVKWMTVVGSDNLLIRWWLT